MENKKKTPTQKYIDEAIQAVLEKGIKWNNVENCVFNGVNFDAKAVNAIELIAKGLITNAEGLKSLAEVLKASNVEIETMFKFTGNGL